jgi:hypothetical protein
MATVVIECVAELHGYNLMQNELSLPICGKYGYTCGFISCKMCNPSAQSVQTAGLCINCETPYYAETIFCGICGINLLMINIPYVQYYNNDDYPF